MKPSDGDRLKDFDPEFARLVSALRSGRPSKAAIARTLDAVDSVGAPAPASVGPRAAKAPLALGAGALALVLAAGGYEWSRRTESAPMTASPVVASTSREEQPAAQPALPELPTASVRVEDLPPATAPDPLPSPAPQAKTTIAQRPVPSPSVAPAGSAKAVAASADDFRDELALVERVRTQLSSGDDVACLRSIDEYGQRFGGGAFVQEVEVMRVEALASSGDRERARAFGGKFLSEHPTSPYAGRVRSVLEKSK